MKATNSMKGGKTPKKGAIPKPHIGGMETLGELPITKGAAFGKKSAVKAPPHKHAPVKSKKK